MTVLACDFRTIVGDRAQGTVTIESVVDRPAHAIPGAVVIPVRETFRLVDGQCAIENIDPGPVAVEVAANGVFRRWEVNIPEDGRHQFSEMLEHQVQWSPAVVSRVEELVAEATRNAAAAGKSASAAKQAEARVAAVVADATGVLRVEIADQVSELKAARDAAAAAASDAAVARDASEEFKEAAAVARDAAESARDQARQQVTVAAGHASTAGASADTARGWAEKSEAAREAGMALIVEGRSLSELGHADADRAESARSAAENAVREATSYATSAEQSAREAAASAESAKEGAPEGGWTKSQLHVNVQATLDKADALPTAQTVQSMIAGKADVSTLQEGLANKLDLQPVSENATQSTLVRRTSEGKIKAAAGSADDDAVTKSQLDAKLDKSPHAWSIYGRDDAGETMIQYSKSADANKIAVRETGGALQVGTPTDPAHAATKDYTDKLIQQLQSTVQQLQSRIATLESTAVTSSDVRKIARGTGSTSTTLYIEGV